jgi:hypothetical protein
VRSLNGYKGRLRKFVVGLGPVNFRHREEFSECRRADYVATVGMRAYRFSEYAGNNPSEGGVSPIDSDRTLWNSLNTSRWFRRDTNPWM